MNVGSHDRRVEHQPFQIGILQSVEHSLPHAFSRPPIKPLKDAVPETETLGQISPWRAGACDPEHGIEEQAIIFRRLSRIAFSPRKQMFDPGPLFIRQFESPHKKPPP